MRKRKDISTDINNQIATPLPGLCAMLNCGRHTAEKVARSAGAEFKIGSRRLYNVGKIKAYIDAVSGGKE